MIAIANSFGAPLLFFSSILIASSLIPGWMRALSPLNQSSALRARRAAWVAGSDAAEIPLCLASSSASQR